MISGLFLAAERAVFAIDAFLNRAVLLAWTSTLQHHVDVDGGSKLSAGRRG
jgi:hypothetical protein